jgi:hypothetical protein
VAARYLWVWLWSTITIVAAVAAFNLAVDPYGVFRVVDLAGFNRIKVQASERGSLFKRSNLRRTRPNALILGNSRAEIGIDPDSPAWPRWAQPVFNLAIPGAGVGAVAGQFAEALDAVDPTLVVIGLDFLDFRVAPDSDEHFATPRIHADLWREIRERASALLTMAALADSVATVWAQRDPYPTGLTDAGFNLKRDYIRVAQREGYFAMFRQRDQENAANYLRGPKSVLQAHGRPAPAFDAVDYMIEASRSRGIRSRLVLYPYHAHTLMLFYLTGLWPAYEEWKRELVNRVDRAGKGIDVEIWDFTGFAPYADEQVPPPGDTRTELQWYWEAGHFKKALGDALLAQMFDGMPSIAPWGRRLTAANIEAELKAQRTARDDYARRRADETRELATLVGVAAGRN